MRQPVDACNHQGLTWMNEVEDNFQLGTALQRRAAALLLAHYSASSRSQRLDLGIEVLIDSRGASISYSGFKSVHFGYACCDMCSLNQYRPKMNTIATVFGVHSRCHFGYTHNEHFYGVQDVQAGYTHNGRQWDPNTRHQRRARSRWPRIQIPRRQRRNVSPAFRPMRCIPFVLPKAQICNFEPSRPSRPMALSWVPSIEVKLSWASITRAF